MISPANPALIQHSIPDVRSPALIGVGACASRPISVNSICHIYRSKMVGVAGTLTCHFRHLANVREEARVCCYFSTRSLPFVASLPHLARDLMIS
ncbi:hypothetical protein M378DRAFT_285501 [Amanita muscaria Koide BX008]|uniref:Uncharacterized protein n=1 Tax=Amanita muscaria (strain Koide BX008) TaxID=946122 RepID=A0A0C2WRP2_AMAMK|nr:hypothetical protein M378DRAFT_285501 [Amanita muscaria Koide BX008]